jgi:hypothetical protein
LLSRSAARDEADPAMPESELVLDPEPEVPERVVHRDQAERGGRAGCVDRDDGHR